MHWNGAFGALLFINHWEYTLDQSFAKTSGYPLLVGLLAWWECYLTKETDPVTGATVYHDNNAKNPDASHEGQKVPDPQIALSFVKRLASAVNEIAQAIGATPPAFATDVLRHLTPFNTGTVASESVVSDIAARVDDGFDVWNHTRCHSDNGFLPTSHSVKECEAHCSVDTTCAIFTFCPSSKVAGCDRGPSCWRFAEQAAGGCNHSSKGWTSGKRTTPLPPGPPPPTPPPPKPPVGTTVWTAARGLSVAKSDMFAMYPIWPTEYVHRHSDAGVLKTARASSRVYSDFRNGRPVELFPAAVRAGANGSEPASWTAKDILDGMDDFLGHTFGSNRLAYAPGGGIENVGVTRAVNEMLVQAPAGNVIELFPVWPADEPARFANLRTKGGYLVSAS